MPSSCGVEWSGTSSGKLKESSIPDAPEHKSHYLNAADTKGDSSFPVVDGSGNLRAGNVNSAWDLRNQGEGVSEQCLRNLDDAFDENVLPASAYENSTMPITVDDPDGEFGMNLEFSVIPQEALSEGFNQYGIRENDDGSIDFRFNAMEPGERKGVNITPEFLRNVVSHDYSRIPVQMDHSNSQMANVGYVEPDKIQFNDMLQLQGHIPNTGSSVKDDIISDFTHEPPMIDGISVGYDPRTVKVRKGERGEPPEFVDARIREFSLTPFPAGYDNGGLTPEFSAAVEQAVIAGEEEEPEPTSNLITRPHILFEK